MENNEEKKKVMFLITGSNIGGAEVVVKNLIFNLDENKFNSSLVSIRPLGIIGEEIAKKRKVYSLEANLKFNPIFIFRLFKIIKKEKPDILHCHLFHANLIGRIVGRIAGVSRIISTVHSDNIGSNFRYFLLRLTDFMNDITVVVSNKIKEGLLEKKVIPEHKIKVVYNGVEEADLSITDIDIENKKRELGVQNNFPILLSVGRLHPVKGHIYLIRAMRLIADKYPKSKLIMIGDGSEKENLTKEVDKLNLKNNVLFLGEINNPSFYYKFSDIFIIPSINEGFGLAILEAISSKLLVVASNVGGVPEIIKEGISGFLFEVGNIEELSKKIDKVISLSIEKKQIIINNADNNFREKFILYKMIENYNHLYL